MTSLLNRIVTVLLLGILIIGCKGKNLLKELPYADGVVEMVHSIDWEVSVPIQFRIKHKGEIIFRSSSVDYGDPTDNGIELTGDYNVIYAFDCVVLINEYDGKTIASGFYAFDLKEGYPKVGTCSEGYYKRILRRWNKFCFEQGVTYPLYDFPEDIKLENIEGQQGGI